MIADKAMADVNLQIVKITALEEEVKSRNHGPSETISWTNLNRLFQEEEKERQNSSQPFIAFFNAEVRPLKRMVVWNLAYIYQIQLESPSFHYKRYLNSLETNFR